jgi:hypothetical protein
MLSLRSSACIAAISAAFFASLVPVCAQSSGTLQTVVDGSVTPELIPDTVAYEHFFTVLATRPGTLAASNDRRRLSYLSAFFKKPCPGQVGDRTLTDDQKTKLVAAAESVMAQLWSLDQQIVAVGATAASAVLQQQRDQELSNAITLLPTSVDPDAADKVRHHVVEHVKTHIKLVTTQIPDQSN